MVLAFGALQWSVAGALNSVCILGKPPLLPDGAVYSGDGLVKVSQTVTPVGGPTIATLRTIHARVTFTVADGDRAIVSVSITRYGCGISFPAEFPIGGPLAVSLRDPPAGAGGGRVAVADRIADTPATFVTTVDKRRVQAPATYIVHVEAQDVFRRSRRDRSDSIGGDSWTPRPACVSARWQSISRPARLRARSRVPRPPRRSPQ